MAGLEYRVRWQREGSAPQSRIYQSRNSALRRSLLVQGRMAEATGDDPSDMACGHCDCAGECRGQTHAEMWAKVAARISPLVAEPTIEVRDVGDWLVPPVAVAKRGWRKGGVDR